MASPAGKFTRSDALETAIDALPIGFGAAIGGMLTVFLLQAFPAMVENREEITLGLQAIVTLIGMGIRRWLCNTGTDDPAVNEDPVV